MLLAAQRLEGWLAAQQAGEELHARLHRHKSIASHCMSR
jgi:hypothetical protein